MFPGVDVLPRVVVSAGVVVAEGVVAIKKVTNNFDFLSQTKNAITIFLHYYKETYQHI